MSTRKLISEDDDENSMEEEEGLDEREPEKAICADRYRILAANGHQMIEEFKH